MNRQTYPLRVRLHGGRNTHAARDVNGGPDQVTACDYFLAADATNTWLPPKARTTCGRCLKTMSRAAR